MDTQKTWFQSFKECITKKYFTFSGRASRTEYWSFFVIFLILIYGTALINSYIDLNFEIGNLTLPFQFIIIFFLLSPLFSVTVRRFHDIGRNAILAILILYTTLFFDVTYIVLIPYLNPEELVYLYNLGISRNLTVGITIAFLIILIIFCSIKGNTGPNKYGPDPLDPELNNELNQIGNE